MQWERSACFPSCTKTGGMESARHLTPHQSGRGVQLKQNLSINSGDTAQPLVSLSNLNINRIIDKEFIHFFYLFFCQCTATDNWTKNSATGAYYQLNLQSALTWGQAQTSCKQQAASLVSILDPNEQAFISGEVPPSGCLTVLKQMQ